MSIIINTDYNEIFNYMFTFVFLTDTLFWSLKHFIVFYSYSAK